MVHWDSLLHSRAYVETSSEILRERRRLPPLNRRDRINGRMLFFSFFESLVTAVGWKSSSSSPASQKYSINTCSGVSGLRANSDNLSRTSSALAPLSGRPISDGATLPFTSTHNACPSNRAMIKADRSPVVVGPAPLLPPAFLAASASRLRRNVSFLIASSVYSVRARLMGALGVDTAPADGVGACVNGEVVRSCSRIRLVSVVMASSFMRYLPLKVCDIHTGGPIHHKPVPG